MDFLLRDDAPLNAHEWSELDQTVQRTLASQVVARRFLPLYGPLGAGVQVIPVDRTPSFASGDVDMVGQADDSVTLASRLYQKLPMLYMDFVLFWRDIEASRTQGIPLDWSLAEAAASFVAQAEDRLILHGDPANALQGLLNTEGRHILQGQKWEEPGSGFQDIVKGIGHLNSAGFYPPYSVVVSPTTYAQWHRLYGNSGVLEIEQIRRMAEQGVYSSAQMPEKSALVLAAGTQNMDVAVGVDASVAFLEASAMNYRFRVMETLTLRVKRPGAICHITPVGA